MLVSGTASLLSFWKQRRFLELIYTIKQIEMSMKMKKTLSKKIELMSVVSIAAIILALYSPMLCHGEEYDLFVDFSPNIINISSERFGDIRVLTGMRYSSFVANGDSIFIYFNGCSDSVPNIKATRDSLGNLILRFSLEDLLYVQGCLNSEAYNYPEVVITMDNGDEYIGEVEAYITDKQQGVME